MLTRRSLLKRALAGIAVFYGVRDLPVAEAESVAPDKIALENLSIRGSLVASGGLCAPLTPYYEIFEMPMSAKPIRDALPSFNASRGGVACS